MVSLGLIFLFWNPDSLFEALFSVYAAVVFGLNLLYFLALAVFEKKKKLLIAAWVGFIVEFCLVAYVYIIPMIYEALDRYARSRL